MSARPISLLKAHGIGPSLVPNRDGIQYEQLRRALCKAISSSDMPINLIRVITVLPTIQSVENPINSSHRDYLLRLSARVHAKALAELSKWYSTRQIDAGMEAIAAWIAWLAEPKQRRLTSEAALRDLLYRKMIFRNQLEILSIAETLTLNLPDAMRDTKIASIVGGWW